MAVYWISWKRLSVSGVRSTQEAKTVCCKLVGSQPVYGTDTANIWLRVHFGTLLFDSLIIHPFLQSTSYCINLSFSLIVMRFHTFFSNQTISWWSKQKCIAWQGCTTRYTTFLITEKSAFQLFFKKFIVFSDKFHHNHYPYFHLFVYFNHHCSGRKLL